MNQKIKKTSNKTVVYLITFFLLLVFLCIVISFFYRKHILNTETIIKQSISKTELVGEDGIDYIIAIDYPVSGSDWLRKGTGEGELINIEGDFLPNNSTLSYEITTKRNEFVFYIDYIEYSDSDEFSIATYYITGWDVLGRVKHKNFLRSISISDFLTSEDLNRDISDIELEEIKNNSGIR